MHRFEKRQSGGQPANTVSQNTVLAGAPRTVTDKLQRVLNAAARVITGTWKFDRGLGQVLHDELHWLDVPDQMFFKLALTVHRCLNGCAPFGQVHSGRRY